jgi:tetratricopeptide (TPR) repeat protein
LAIAMAAAVAMGGYFIYEKYVVAKKGMAQDIIGELKESERFQQEAALMPTETSREAEEALRVFQKSSEAAARAQSLLKDDVAEGHRAQVAAAVDAAQLRVTEAERRVELAKRNEKLLADLATSERLAAIRLVGFRPDFDASKAAFKKTFRDYGVDVLAGEPAQSAKKLKVVPEKRRGELARGIDYWAAIDKESRDQLRLVANGFDDNPWRRDFRKALQGSDEKELLRLAGNPIEAIAAGETDILGDALREMKHVNESIKLLRDAERTRRNDYWIQMSLGHCLCQMKPPDFPGAAASFKAAASIEEKSAAAASNYALALIRMGEVEQAVNQMRAAVALQETSAPLQCNLAVVLNSQRLGNKDAKKAAERARELDPKYEEATAVLALCHLVEGDKTGCKNLLDKLSTDAQDTSVPLLCRMILALVTLPPKEHEAAKYARRLYTVDPRSEAGLFGHVLAEVLDGDTLAAEKAANELIAECPYGIWEAMGETIRAEVIMYQGRLKEADDALNAALRRKDLPTAHDARFKLRLHQGRFEEAAEELKKLKEANKDVTILNTLYQVNQFLLDGAMKIDHHMAAVASGKEKESEIFRSMIAEAALLRGKTRLARDLYGKMMIDKPSLEKFNSHGSSVVCSYEGVSHRTNAARAGIRLADGNGTDLGTVTEADRVLAR